MKEIELKFLGIEVPAVVQKLQAAGAKMMYESDSTAVYFADDKLGLSYTDTTKAFMRLRTLNGKTVLTYKGALESGDYRVREEHEVEVSDFDMMLRLLTALGFTASHPIRKHRLHFSFGSFAYEIDTLPGIPPFLEIEVPTEDSMPEACRLVGLRPIDGKKEPISVLYPQYNEML